MAPPATGVGRRRLSGDCPGPAGYGRTGAPPNVADYCIEALIADIGGLLDAADLESAIFIGHDWGAILLWHMAMLAPDRIEKLVILNIPHVRRPLTDPIMMMRERYGDGFYIVNFQDSDEADRVFAENPAHFFDVVMRHKQISRQRFDSLPPERKVVNFIRSLKQERHFGEPLLLAEERDYYAAAFTKSGFTGPINWYRNWTHNWRVTEGVDRIITIPTLFIGAVDDVIIAPEQIEAMQPLVTDLTIRMLEDCGHWSQQEKPAAVNRLILDWLVQRR